LLIALLAASIPISAHHGNTEYDTAKTVTITGTVTNYLYINPHVLIVLERKNDRGEMDRWQGELPPPAKLSRAGWSKYTLKAGDSVSISGNPARNGAHTIWITKIVGPGGAELQLFED
jgi:hypothetical protein